VVDAGLAEELGPHPALMQRKIAFGTRSSRVASAMSVDQAHAAIRAGMEIADSLPGNVLACAGIGVGAHESASLVISRLADAPLESLVSSGDEPPSSTLMSVLDSARSRHHAVTDPVEVLAAFGGFEVAMMVGAMLVAASKRSLIMVDGMSACAALLVAARIASPATDYALFCRSHNHPGLDQALALFHSSALLELGMDATDGTGATLAWPLVQAAAALLTEVAEGEDAGPTLPPQSEMPTLDNVVEPAGLASGRNSGPPTKP
jgi:nicotinate-nucleotide--dimethylbenzimidazole phosphoribosyltransferase